MKILLVEDYSELAKSIVSYFSQENYSCEVATSFDQAREKLELFTYDVVLLDIMLPDGNGLDLLRQLRKNRVESSVIIISAHNALDFKLTGLSEGVDDYLTKPFPLPELHARIKAITRRRNPNQVDLLTIKDISINLQSMACSINGKMLNLSQKEAKLLLYLLDNKDRMLTRQAIATHLWGEYTDNLDSVDFVHQHMKNLRMKIADAGGQDYISTVYGLGYKFDSAN